MPGDFKVLNLSRVCFLVPDKDCYFDLKGSKRYHPFLEQCCCFPTLSTVFADDSSNESILEFSILFCLFQIFFNKDVIVIQFNSSLQNSFNAQWIDKKIRKRNEDKHISNRKNHQASCKLVWIVLNWFSPGSSFLKNLMMLPIIFIAWDDLSLWLCDISSP